MENPSDFIQVDINSLPVIDDIVAGNQFIVETVDGTKTINYENVIFGPDNTSFYNEIVNNTTNIDNLSTEVLSVSTNTQAFVPTTSVSTFSSDYLVEYSGQLSDLTSQTVSLTTTYNNSYINDAYISRTPFGVKAMCIFSTYGVIIQKTASVTSIIAVRNSTGDPTGKYIVNLNGLSNNNFAVNFQVYGRDSNLRPIFPVLLEKNSTTLVLQASAASTATLANAGDLFFVIYGN